MLYPLLRPFLFRLDPEHAHERAMAAARFLAHHPRLAACVRRLLARPARLPVRVLGLDFPHPVGLAAGFDKNAQAPLAWWALGFGFVELGTVTPRPQPGHPRPRMFRFPKEQALVNRMGFNNDGAEAVAERLTRQAQAGLRPPFPLGISIGKNAATPLEAAIDDYGFAAVRLAPLADFLTINVSSPNTPSLRDLQAPAELARLVAAVRGAASAKPVLIKLAPEIEGDTLRGILDAALAAGAAGVIAVNTLATTHRPDLPPGGLSGRPLRDIALRRVELIRHHCGDRAAVIGCGGIADAGAARNMLAAGADLIQVYTGLVYEGPFLAARLSRALRP